VLLKAMPSTKSPTQCNRNQIYAGAADNIESFGSSWGMSYIGNLVASTDRAVSTGGVDWGHRAGRAVLACGLLWLPLEC